MVEEIFKLSKKAAKVAEAMDDGLRDRLLRLVADNILAKADMLLAANKEDLARMDPDNPMADRLRLTKERLDDIACSMRRVAALPSPLGLTLSSKTLANGLAIKKVSVPYGVVGVVYEARPNVTFDVFAICLKSGNACVLKCGKDATASCQAAVSLMRDTLRQAHVTPDIVALLPPTHDATKAMLNAVGYIDLCIPRGGKKLINFVRDNARVPVIETGAGVVHCFFDKAGDIEMGKRIIDNAKTRRCSVCNALDCLIVHAARLSDLPHLVLPLAQKGVRLHADPRALNALQGHYPDELLTPAEDNDAWATEWLSMQMGVKTVDTLDEALQHIETYGSGHSECIVTNDKAAAHRFQLAVDAACVYVNAPTSFTDGGQFGLGAEIGISTQKLGARGPMGLEEMTTCKWLINGNGQVRP